MIRKKKQKRIKPIIGEQAQRSFKLSKYKLDVSNPKISISFNPPNWLFGPVWSLLYTMMAIALWGIWKQDMAAAVSTAMIWFFIQLALNSLWSFAFFYFESPAAGLFVIIPLLITILITILQFWAIAPWTAYLLIPYLLWVSFAALLNTAIWWLN